MRKKRPDFSEKALGFRGFLQFAKAAEAAGTVSLAWDDDADDYLVTASRRCSAGWGPRNEAPARSGTAAQADSRA